VPEQPPAHPEMLNGITHTTNESHAGRLLDVESLCAQGRQLREKGNFVDHCASLGLPACDYKLILARSRMRILFETEGQADFDALPSRVKARVLEIVEERLPLWPNVSGAKPLRYQWKGCYRIRTGDYRVIFRVVAPNLLVVRIQHRSNVYED